MKRLYFGVLCFMDNAMKNKRGAELATNPFSGCEIGTKNSCI